MKVVTPRQLVDSLLCERPPPCLSFRASGRKAASRGIPRINERRSITHPSFPAPPLLLGGRGIKTMKECAVYLLTNRHRTVLYVGVTSNLRQRVAERIAGVHPSSFTRRNNVDRLVYVETTPDIRAAIAREKQIKGWSRCKKEALIDAFNSNRRDLAEDVRAEVLSGDSSTRHPTTALRLRPLTERHLLTLLATILMSGGAA